MEGAVQGYTEREATGRAGNGRGYDQARHAGHCYRVPTESHRHVCAQLVCNSLMSEFEVQFRDDSPASADQLYRLLFNFGIRPHSYCCECRYLGGLNFEDSIH